MDDERKVALLLLCVGAFALLGAMGAPLEAYLLLLLIGIVGRLCLSK